jgi:hypothetical protein
LSLIRAGAELAITSLARLDVALFFDVISREKTKYATGNGAVF